MRLVAHGDWALGDEQLRRWQQQCDRELWETVVDVLCQARANDARAWELRTWPDDVCCVDDVLRALDSNLACGPPKRGDLVRFLRGHPETFRFEADTFRVALR